MIESPTPPDSMAFRQERENPVSHKFENVTGWPFESFLECPHLYSYPEVHDPVRAGLKSLDLDPCHYLGFLASIQVHTRPDSAIASPITITMLINHHYHCVYKNILHGMLQCRSLFYYKMPCLNYTTTIYYTVSCSTTFPVVPIALWHPSSRSPPSLSLGHGFASPEASNKAIFG